MLSKAIKYVCASVCACECEDINWHELEMKEIEIIKTPNDDKD